GIRTDKLLSSSVISETAPSDEIIHYGTKAIEGEEIITRTEITPFNIIEEVDPNLYEGEIVTKVEGQNGEFTYYDYYRTIKGTKELAAFKSEAKEIKPKIDKVVRIGTKQIEGEIIEKSSEKIPFGMIIEEDNSLFEDERVVIREGVPGIVDVVATYKTSKGEKIGEPINVQSFIQREAVDELVKVGTKPLNTTSKVENLNEIPFTVVKEYDDSLEEGVEKIIKVGKNGQKKIIVTTNYVRGIQDGESIVEEITIEEPQNQVILVGTKTLQKESPSPNNDNTDSQTKIDIPSSDDNLPKVPKIPNNTQSDIEKPIEKETKDSSEINQKGSSQTDVNKSKTTTKLDSNTTNNTNGSKLPETG
ncbi:TPA: G5 domain-containing protein, partial [Streptococcus suis]